MISISVQPERIIRQMKSISSEIEGSFSFLSQGYSRGLMLFLFHI